MAGFKVFGFDKLKNRLAKFTEAGRKTIADWRSKIEREAGRLEAILYRNAPKKTGKYASEIETTVTGSDTDLKITIDHPRPLGKWITEGTPRHMIYPVNAKMLRFPIGGRVVFAAKVNHPGTKPNPFITHSIGEWEAGAVRTLNAVASQYVEIAESGGN